MTDNKYKLNIHGVLDLDQMAAVMTSLIDQVDRQNKVINELRDSLSFYVNSNTFNDKINNIEQILGKTSSKLDAVHIATTATVLNKKISAGDLSSSNFQQLNKLLKNLMQCATKAELARQEERINELETGLLRIHKTVDKIMTLQDQISRSQLNQATRIGILESAMAGKIDRSEMNHLESLVSKVETYDQFKNSTIGAVEDLHRFERDANQRLQQIFEHLNKHDRSLQLHSVDLGKLAPKKELHALAREMNNQQEQLNRCASLDSLKKVRDELCAAEELLGRHSIELSCLRSDAQELHADVDGKASLQAVRNCVTRRHYEQAVAALGAEVDAKTPRITTEQIQKEVNDLRSKLDAESERMEVAMRFVEWYSGRGENYEHNMKIIDKHLKSLISSAPGRGTGEPASKVHSYFMPQNQVVFSPTNPVNP